LELKRDKKGEARDLFTSAQVSGVFRVVAAVLLTLFLNLQSFAPHNYEPFYNIALIANKAGQYQVAICGPIFVSFTSISAHANGY
jgi:hypothetical protein